MNAANGRTHYTVIPGGPQWYASLSPAEKAEIDRRAAAAKAAIAGELRLSKLQATPGPPKDNHR